MSEKPTPWRHGTDSLSVDNPIDDLGQCRLSVHGTAFACGNPTPQTVWNGRCSVRRIRTIKQVVAFVEVNESFIDPAPPFPPPAHRRFGGWGDRVRGQPVENAPPQTMARAVRPV